MSETTNPQLFPNHQYQGAGAENASSADPAASTASAAPSGVAAASATAGPSSLDEASAAFFRDRFQAIAHEVKKEILTPEGQEDFVEQLLICLFARGHALLEGRPGLGKTLLVRALGKALGLEFGRVQFTPDLMPSDITGTTVLQTEPSGALFQEFRPGPVFANIVLADEINRASPKTQASLLEVMAERQLTVAGVTYRPGQDYNLTQELTAPETGLDNNGLFHVLATQNPIEQEGTYPLPEAQLDRFLFKLIIPSPDDSLLARIVTLTTGAEKTGSERAMQVAGLSFEDIQRMQSLPPLVETAPSALVFAVKLCQTLNPLPEAPSDMDSANRYVMYGPSPRGAQSLILAAKTYALTLDEPSASINAAMVAKVALSALRHRVVLNYRAANEGVRPEALIAEAVERCLKPAVKLG